MAKQDNKSFFSEWLEKLQQESWQLELLISGLALFGIYESQDLLIELKMYINNNSEGLTRFTQAFFLKIFEVGWKIFFINLLIHVILRGLWIGAIGLRYVSQDIDFEALNYSEYFTESLKRKVGEFDDFIERLEKICSVLFAYTFLLFLLLFSIAFFFFQIVFVGDLINHFGKTQAVTLSLALVIYVLVGFIVFIDFITLGLFKRINDRRINKIYNAIFTLYGWTTLTFLYRPLLYNFLDNRYTRRLFYFSIPYIIIIAFSGNMFTNNNYVYYPESTNIQKYGHYINRMNYEDLRQEYMTEVNPEISKRRQMIPPVLLNKYMNDEDYLSIFIKMEPRDYKKIKKNSNINPYQKPGFSFSLFSSQRNEDSFYKEGKQLLEEDLTPIRKRKRELNKLKRKLTDSIQILNINTELDSLESLIVKRRETFKESGKKFEDEKQQKIINSFLDLIQLEMNGSEFKQDLDCYFFQHSNNNEKGIMCHYPMDSLDFGKHELYIYKSRKGSNDRVIETELTLPFYKVRSYPSN